MACYFDEHNCEPDNRSAQWRQRNSEGNSSLLHLVRALLAGNDLPGWLTEVEGFDEAANGMLAPPASKVAVEELEKRRLHEHERENELKCPVCIAQFDEEDTLVELPCEHLFHEQCISPWLEKTNSCPNCRFELPTDNPEYERRKKEKEEAAARESRVQEYHNSMFG